MLDQHDRIAEIAPYINYQWEILTGLFLLVVVVLSVAAYLSEDD